MPSQFRNWLQLFRAPNLFTVPGDPLAGYFLASYGAVEPLLFLPPVVSLFFYASGLLLNDLADLAEDRAERPARPLPSGAASPPLVAVVMVLLAIAGLALCAKIGVWTLGVGGALLLTIASYNLGGKSVPGMGALNMGLCRGLSLLLGATAVPHGDLTIRLMFSGRVNHLFTAFLLTTLFIAAITNLARFETKSAAPAYAKWLPAAAIAGGAVNFLRMVNTPSRLPTAALFALAFTISTQVAWQLTSDPGLLIPPMIGKLIRLLLVIQAAYCAACGNLAGSFAAGIFITLWPLSRAAGRRFYAS